MLAWALFAQLALLAIPATSGAGLIGDTVDGVTDAVGPGGPAPAAGEPGGDAGATPPTSPFASESGGTGAPAAGQPPNYEPPLHGSNPHGQGTVGVIDLSPSQDVPLSSDPSGVESGEDIVVGRSRGERTGGDYHGHITIASVAPLGIEIAVDTSEGETQAGPLDAIQTGLLDALCDGSGNQVCLEVLRADSSTTSAGSTNSFAVANANLGGPNGISATVAESNGNISESGSCGTSSADSVVANANVGGALTADVIEANSSSSACRNGATSIEQSSRVIDLSENGIPLPNPGCADGTPDSSGGAAIPGVLDFVCNADDTNGVGEPFGAQAVLPYGVREGLSVFVLPALNSELVKLTTAASESRAVAPRRPADGDDRDDDGTPDDRDDCPNRPGPASNNGCPLDGDIDGNGALSGAGGCPGDRDCDGVPDEGPPDARDKCPDVPGPTSNQGCPFGGGELAFTGSDIWAVLLIGGLVLTGGVTLRRLTPREV